MCLVSLANNFIGFKGSTKGAQILAEAIKTKSLFQIELRSTQHKPHVFLELCPSADFFAVWNRRSMRRDSNEFSDEAMGILTATAEASGVHLVVDGSWYST